MKNVKANFDNGMHAYRIYFVDRPEITIGYAEDIYEAINKCKKEGLNLTECNSNTLHIEF